MKAYMSNTTNLSTHLIQKLLQLSMVLTMGISLFLLFGAVYRAPECPEKRIVAATPAGTKTFYTFADGSSVWSENGFSVGEAVCLK